MKKAFLRVNLRTKTFFENECLIAALNEEHLQLFASDTEKFDFGGFLTD